MPIFDAAMKYKSSGTPLVVLAGKEYGTGSSRDWAAKGSNLLGVRAVIAESYERIHRNNLVGMGVLPLQFEPGQSWESVGLKGDETFDIDLSGALTPRQKLAVSVTRPDGSTFTFDADLAPGHAGRSELLQERRHFADGVAGDGAVGSLAQRFMTRLRD